MNELAILPTTDDWRFAESGNKVNFLPWVPNTKDGLLGHECAFLVAENSLEDYNYVTDFDAAGFPVYEDAELGEWQATRCTAELPYGCMRARDYQPPSTGPPQICEDSCRCSQSFGQDAWLATPGFPNSFNGMENCHFNISTTEGTAIRIQFETLTVFDAHLVVIWSEALLEPFSDSLLAMLLRSGTLRDWFRQRANKPGLWWPARPDLSPIKRSDAVCQGGGCNRPNVRVQA